jgi:hypothetical protein
VHGSAHQHHRWNWRIAINGPYELTWSSHSILHVPKRKKRARENLPASVGLAATESHCNMTSLPQRTHPATSHEALCALILVSSPHVQDFSCYASCDSIKSDFRLFKFTSGQVKMKNTRRRQFSKRCTVRHATIKRRVWEGHWRSRISSPALLACKQSTWHPKRALRHFFTQEFASVILSISQSD